MIARCGSILLCGTLIVLLLGCGKKDEDGGGGGGGDSTEYTINVRTPGEGSSLRGTLKVDLKMSVDVKDNNGKPIPEAEGKDIKEEIGYRETIDAFPDGSKRPTRSRITIDKWEKAKGAQGLSKDGVMPKIVGREITVEKIGGFYDIRATDNGGIDPGLRLFLDKRYQDFYDTFNVHDFLPGKPVRLYSSWDLPVKKMLKALGSEAGGFPLDESKSKGSAKLTRVWDKDGRKYGRIEMTANLVLRIPDKDVTVKDSKIAVNWAVELCIDGSKHDVSATATVDISFDIASAKQGSGSVKMKGTVALTEFEEKVGKAANPAKPKSDTTQPGKGDGFPTGAVKEETIEDSFPDAKAPPAKKMPVEKAPVPAKAPDGFKTAPPPKGFK